MLIAIEGIDGAGKSTQAQLLIEWLEASREKVFLTKWNSSSIVKPAAKKGKKERSLKPTTFALLEAADLADRYDREILPAIADGQVVIADRWVYTAFARGMGRRLDAAWLRGIYSFAPRPDICFYLTLPVEVALERIRRERELKHYEAGMDVGFSADPAESFLEFQGMALAAYNGLQMAGEHFVPIDAQSSIEDLHRQIIHAVGQVL